MNTPVTLGIDHLGLTVKNLEASVKFFTEVLGWSQFGGNPDYPSAYVTDGYSKLTLWEKKAGAFNGFDRHKNIGLHHFALKVPSLEVLHHTFDLVKGAEGVEVEFSPEPSGKGPKLHFMIREPGGTRLEFAFDPR
ncbi:VOC family protein [Flexibacterium corallicola]|uniref:VOC family protein n=1 Tax=Flexibacterium corallicola TaxID=3037259 RepID=UPI00286EF60E|nr:VOC family protein [Pseudovibrio sp. M1P-2-3]